LLSKDRLTVGIMGAAGYTGGELCRLLLNHPTVKRIVPSARSSEAVDVVHPNLLGSGLSFVDLGQLRERAETLDVIFFCTPPGTAMHEAPWFLDNGCRVIDLSADFRFQDPDVYQMIYGFEHAAPELLIDCVYGVTELNRAAISASRIVANPGCYVITSLLALAPLLHAGWAETESLIHISAVNGTTGAGSNPKKQIMHAEAFNSMLPYSMDGHRHLPELEEHLSRVADGNVTVDFNTAHGNFSRGIYLQANVTVRAEHRDGMSRDKMLALLTDFYGEGSAKEFFVRVSNAAKSEKLNEQNYQAYPSLAGVIGSNFCHVGADYDLRGATLKLFSVTDNLVKGAAGSAIQNMNVMLGLDETAGLRSYGLY
jgi:N-acetyl-gamma-glutamyl-phosphate reductase common form